MQGRARLEVRHVKRLILTASAMAALGLAACEQGKPRHPPPDPMALAPATAPAEASEGPPVRATH
jgi:hypothetical protein